MLCRKKALGEYGSFWAERLYGRLAILIMLEHICM